MRPRAAARARRVAGGWLAAGTLMTGLAACGTSAATFGGGAGHKAAGAPRRTTTTATQTRTAATTATQTRTAATTGTQTSTAATTATQTTPKLTAQLRVLQTTIPFGGTVHADLVLTNNAATTRVLARGCRGQFLALILSSAKASSTVPWSDAGCNPTVPFVAHPGTTTYPLTLQADFGRCIVVGHKATGAVPQCLPGDQMPPLPAGSYKVSLSEGVLSLAQVLGNVTGPSIRIKS